MPSYKFLTTGDLEIPTRNGWRIVPGCSCRGIFEFADRMAELQEILASFPEDDPRTIEQVYQEHQRFAYLCNRALELNGIDPDWIRPRDLTWLLFGHVDEEGTVQPSPLMRLNEPAPARYPKRPTKEQGKGDFISLLAAIASQPDTSAEEAFRLATSEPARLVLGMLEDREWHSQTPEERDEVQFKAQADAFRAQFQGGAAPMPVGPPPSAPTPKPRAKRTTKKKAPSPKG
jgi:hypothetical protein